MFNILIPKHYHLTARQTVLLSLLVFHPIKFHALYKLEQVYYHIKQAQFDFDHGGYAYYEVPKQVNKWHKVLKK